MNSSSFCKSSWARAGYKKTLSLVHYPCEIKFIRSFSMLLVPVLLLLTLVEPSSTQLSPLVTCKSHQMTSLRDSMTSSWLISQRPGTNGSIRCSMLCLQEVRCVSFLYNDVTHDCRLFAVIKREADITSVAVGYRYYDTCRGEAFLVMLTDINNHRIIIIICYKIIHLLLYVIVCLGHFFCHVA